MKINGNSSDIAFYFDLVEFYNQNRMKLNRKLRIKDESNILDFCSDYYVVGPDSAQLKYENICKLVYVFANVLGRPMPDYINNRLILGQNNEWIKKYIEYIGNLKPYYFGIINTNKNNFKLNYLSTNGHLGRFALK